MSGQGEVGKGFCLIFFCLCSHFSASEDWEEHKPCSSQEPVGLWVSHHRWKKRSRFERGRSEMKKQTGGKVNKLYIYIYIIELDLSPNKGPIHWPTNLSFYKLPSPGYLSILILSLDRGNNWMLFSLCQGWRYKPCSEMRAQPSRPGRPLSFLLRCLPRVERGGFSFISLPINTVAFCEVFVYMSLLSSFLSGEPLIYLLCFLSTGVDRGSYGLTALFRASGRCWYHSS